MQVWKLSYGVKNYAVLVEFGNVPTFVLYETQGIAKRGVLARNWKADSWDA